MKFKTNAPGAADAMASDVAASIGDAKIKQLISSFQLISLADAMEKLNFNKEWSGFKERSAAWAIVAKADGGSEPSLGAHWMFEWYATLCADCGDKMSVRGTMGPFLRAPMIERVCQALADHMTQGVPSEVMGICDVRGDASYKIWSAFERRLTRLVEAVDADPDFIPAFIADIGLQRALIERDAIAPTENPTRVDQSSRL